MSPASTCFLGDSALFFILHHNFHPGPTWEPYSIAFLVRMLSHRNQAVLSSTKAQQGATLGSFLVPHPCKNPPSLSLSGDTSNLWNWVTSYLLDPINTEYLKNWATNSFYLLKINQVWAIVKIRTKFPFNVNRSEIHTRHTINELSLHAQKP